MLKEIIAELADNTLLKKVEKLYPFYQVCEKISERTISPEVEFAKIGHVIKSLDLEIEWSKKDLQTLSKVSQKIDFRYWKVSDLLRTFILLATLRHDNYEIIIKNCYLRGNTKEQACVLKMLSLFPHNKTLQKIAVGAIRTNIPDVIASLACGNPFPYYFFSEHEYNNMILKCIFMGIPIRYTYNLRNRLNQELCRMINEYMDEREAAGRDFPKDIWLGLFITNDKSAKRICKYLTGKDEEHRQWVIECIHNHKNKEMLSYLEQHLKEQTEQTAKEIVQQQINKIRN